MALLTQTDPNSSGNPIMDQINGLRQPSDLAGLSQPAKDVLTNVHQRLLQGANLSSAMGQDQPPAPVPLTRPAPAQPLNLGAQAKPDAAPAPLATSRPLTMSPALQTANEKYQNLADSTPGSQQVKNPFLHGLSVAGDIALSGLFPRISAVVPGTTTHHNVLVNQAQGELANQEGLEADQAKNAESVAQAKNLESLPDLHKAQLENAETKLDLQQQKQDSTTQHQKDANESTLHAHGYKTGDDGTIVPLEYKEMSEQQQAVHDLKASQQEVAAATADYKKAQSANMPEQMELARKRAENAAASSSIAAQRLGLSRDQFEARTLGTNHGVALPGTMIGDDGRPVGSAFQQNVRPTGQERNKADLASSAHDQLADIKSIVQKRPDIFGPAAGRKTDFDVWLGSQDPDAQRFRAARTIAGDHLAGVFGGRSEAALHALDSAIGQFKDNPDAVAAGIDQLDKANNRFVNKGTVKTTGSNAAADAAGPQTVTMTSPDGKTTSKVPADQAEHYKKLGAKVVQ